MFYQQDLKAESYPFLIYDEIKTSILINGDGSSDSWDKEWRLKLLNNYLILAKQLWSLGVNDTYLDGSLSLIHI